MYIFIYNILNPFIEKWLTFKKLYIFNAYSLPSLEISVCMHVC